MLGVGVDEGGGGGEVGPVLKHLCFQGYTCYSNALPKCILGVVIHVRLLVLNCEVSRKSTICCLLTSGEWADTCNRD